jgi:hypothetical protein
VLEQLELELGLLELGQQEPGLGQQALERKYLLMELLQLERALQLEPLVLVLLEQAQRRPRVLQHWSCLLHQK